MEDPKPNDPHGEVTLNIQVSTCLYAFTNIHSNVLNKHKNWKNKHTKDSYAIIHIYFDDNNQNYQILIDKHINPTMAFTLKVIIKEVDIRPYKELYCMKKVRNQKTSLMHINFNYHQFHQF